MMDGLVWICICVWQTVTFRKKWGEKKATLRVFLSQGNSPFGCNSPEWKAFSQNLLGCRHRLSVNMVLNISPFSHVSPLS